MVIVVCGGGGGMGSIESDVRKLIIILLFTKLDNINNYYG